MLNRCLEFLLLSFSIQICDELRIYVKKRFFSNVFQNETVALQKGEFMKDKDNQLVTGYSGHVDPGNA